MSEDVKTRITRVQSVVIPSAGDNCLVLIYPPGPEIGKRFILERAEHTIGRGTDCDIQVDSDAVSRRHAHLLRDVGGWLLEDLGSTNGTYVNDRPVGNTPLRDGDLIKIGKTIFKFLSGTNVEASYHEEIYRMTIVDALTGVHNKRYFLEFLEREIARCARHGRLLSLILFDLDHFKAVNDEYGHLTGDAVLKEIGRRLGPRIRREELLARYGGEEFGVVLPETGLEGALQFAEVLRQMIANKPFAVDGHLLPITISLGVATVLGEVVDTNLFIKQADDNLYRAKHAGRNCVVG